MIILTLARKPLSEGSVAANALKHGTGGLDIDGCRVSFQTISGASLAINTHLRGQVRKTLTTGASLFAGMKETEGVYIPTSGRWSANLILCHLPECQKTGTTMVPGYQINRWEDGAKPFGGGAGHPYTSETTPTLQEDVWECAPGCLVVALDQQNGVSVSSGGGGHQIKGTSTRRGIYGVFGERHLPANVGKGDVGGVSRFFKQVRQ